MKTIKIKNIETGQIFNFLQNLELKGKASRGRTQLMKRLDEKNKEFLADLTELQKEHFETDKNGDLISDENGMLNPLGEAEAREAETKGGELQQEVVEISFGEYSSKYEALFSALDELDVPLVGHQAEVYDTLMTAYESIEKGDK
jgi:hypothetical protein